MPKIFGNEWDIFLDRTITGDETWVHHYEPESIRQSMEWIHPQSPCKKRLKSQPSSENWCLQCFGTHKAQYWNIIRRSTTINSAWYSEMFTGRLKPAIRRKRRGLLSKGVVLLHNNARPHTAAETLRKLKFQVMAHPLYSPDLAPSDYHLFCPLKEDSPRTKKWRKRCMRGSLLSRYIEGDKS